MSDYTRTPNKLRIVRDEGMTGIADVDLVWQLDGIDTRKVLDDTPDGVKRYAYTEQVWNFPTFADAIKAMPEFVARFQSFYPLGE